MSSSDRHDWMADQVSASADNDATAAAARHGGNCPEHGYFEALQLPGRMVSRCPQCIEAEHARHFAEQDRRRLAALEQRRQEQHEEALTRANLRGRFRHVSFATFSAETPAQQRVLKACHDFAAGPLDAWRVLLLLGTPGSGKTHLGAAMAHTVIARGRSALMLTARELVRRLRATWARDSSETEQDVIDHLARCSLLVLDELGVGFGTDAELVQLLDVIDTRYRECRPTVVISNLTAEQLRVLLGERLSDRIREASELHLCTWPSHRRPSA